MVNSNLTNSQTNLSGGIATNLVFIDTAVANFSNLLAGLKPNTEAIVLDPTQDGISQITNFLSQHSGIVDSIQILGHGAAGMLQLGSTSLSSENLQQYQSALSTWFSPQTGKTPDLLIYGCDVASGEIGENFIQKLSQITGADVAASVDLTGSIAKGGNWILEKATGAIEAGQAFTQKVRDAYEDVLATFTVTNNDDSGAGSLRQAIISANTTGGADDIVFNIGSGGVQTIKLLTPLPAIVSQINIDATTQPGSGGKPAIELRGDAIPVAGAANAFPADVNYSPTFTNGLTFWNGSNNSIAKGFVINRFESSGIKIGQGNNYARTIVGPTGITIDNNYIGTDTTGTVGLGNGWNGDPNVSNGIYVHRSANTTIRNNLISGNTTTALIIREGSTFALVEDNKIGTDVTGTLPLGNQRWSTYINQGSNNVIYRRNLVAAGGYDYETNGMELFLSWGVSNLTVQDNIFGTDITGTKSFRNRGQYLATTTNPVALRSFSMGNATVGTGNLVNRGWTAQPAGNTTSTLAAPPQPILTPISPKLATIPNDITNAANQGQLISTLVGSSINTAHPDQGISITQVNNTNGTWQYSTDNGTNWSGLAQALTTNYEFTLPAVQANFQPAFLLAADSKNRIRFVPNAGFVGTVTNDVTYNGWNYRTAGNGLLINIDPNPSRRPNLAPLLNSLSVNADRLNIKVNKAPIIDPNLVDIVGNIPVNPATNPGTLVSAILGTGFSDDQTALKGIAVTAVDNSNGTWEYALDGTTWQAFGSPSNSVARLLSADGTTKIRFVPNSGYVGTPALSFRAWDQFADWSVVTVPGGTANVSTNGGVTAFSSAVAETRIGVGSPITSIIPAPIVPTTPPDSPTIDINILRLLKNPDAPATPQPVVVGEVPVDNTSNVDSNSGVSSPSSNVSNPVGNSGTAVGNEDCPCEVIIKQQKPNLVTNTLWGTNSKDSLTGTATTNVIYGLQDDDTIAGTPNPDNLYGGQGNDLIRGLKQRDFIRGGGGDDTIYGGRGQDLVKGGGGDDTIYGGRGADFLGGGNGNDTTYGDRGNDFISGGKGNDRLFGGAGNDNLCGCDGDDFLRGGRGNDVLNGEKGNDIVVGGFGDDTLTGGLGSDRFRFAPSTGTDTITDFTVGEDLIELVRGLKFSDLQITQGVGTAILSFQPSSLFASDKPLAILTGVNAASLTTNNFLVV